MQAGALKCDFGEIRRKSLDKPYRRRDNRKLFAIDARRISVCLIDPQREEGEDVKSVGWKRVSWLWKVAIMAGLAAVGLAPGTASGAVGDQLDLFTPASTGLGRGMAMTSTTSTKAYYSAYMRTQDKLRIVDLKTHEYLGDLDTDMEAYDVGRDYGSLSLNRATNELVGARYSSISGNIDSISTGTGAITPLFNARDISLFLSGIDGLAADPDGTFWISGDGIGLGTTTIYHVTRAGAEIATFDVGFGNSGLIADGENLWLVDVNNARVHQYTKAGVATGVAFNTAVSEPEDGTIDRCTFTGKKALWLYEAAGGRMIAHEIGTSDNAGCEISASPPTTDPPRTSPPLTDPGGPAKIEIGKPEGGGNHEAGRPIWFTVPSTLDPLFNVFIYIWLWDDYLGFNPGDSAFPTAKRRDPSTEPGKTQHEYRCAGIYSPSVKVLDSFGNTRTIPVETNLVVAFPADTAKKHGSLAVSPLIRAKGSKGAFSLAVTRRKRAARASAAGRTRIRDIVYRVDGKKIGKSRKAKKKIRRTVAPGPHALNVKTRFHGPGGKKVIKTCFQLTS